MKILKMRSLLVLVFLIYYSTSSGQFANTLTLDTVNGSPNAELLALDWIIGSWEGEAFGAQAEEIWSLPKGNSMMGMFKLYNAEQVIFYELMIIKKHKNSLLLQLKHFDEHLDGWEERTESIDFPLVKVEPKKVYFDQLTFENVSEDAINVYVVIEHDDGTKEEVLFKYQRL